jgi:formate hydrogenlyase transcriptional activator
VPVEVPPLRERREDIPALAAHFVERLARQFGRRIEGLSSSMIEQLMSYEWPGNIRELENLLAHAIVLSPGGVLDGSLFAAGPNTPAAGSDTHAAEPPRGFASLEDAERRHIESVLASTRWVVEGPKGAAAILNVNASTLRSRLKRLGLRRPA